MFTGLVESMGQLRGREPLAAGERFEFQHALGALCLGESVAVSGACLTVIASTAETFFADLSPETLERTVLGALSVGDLVNFERALASGQRLGGHLVTGHVDGVGTVRRKDLTGEMTVLEIAIGEALGRYAAEKGSVTIDGVSLTINGVTDDSVELCLIPHTAQITTLGRLSVSSRVNVEVDLIARYVERLLARS